MKPQQLRERVWIKMTSNKSKTARLKQNRLLQAKAHIGIDTNDPNVAQPPGAVPADQKELFHNNT